MLGFEAGCSAAAVIRLENNLALVCRATGGETLSDRVHVVKNRRAVGYVTRQVVLLIADGFCRWEIKNSFLFLQVMKSENKRLELLLSKQVFT